MGVQKAVGQLLDASFLDQQSSGSSQASTPFSVPQAVLLYHHQARAFRTTRF